MKRIRSLLVAAALACLAQGPLSLPVHADAFDDWLTAFKSDAAAQGRDPALLDRALEGIRPIDRVLELDRRQPEFSISFEHYMQQVVSPARVAKGRLLLRQNRAALASIARRQGVPAPQIVALWGIESDYGRMTGNFPVLASLATLAFDGRRSQYFRGELLKALDMVAAGIAPGHMQGSWAGAMGQCQFMPSTYQTYAQAAAGDAPADIWSNQADVWNSAAHYLAGLDWRSDEPWGMAVRLPKHGMAAALFGLEPARGLRDWQRLGLRRADGRPLRGPAGLKLALIHADAGKDGKGGDGPAYLVGNNFRALLHWNRSFFFAIAAGTLADRVASR